MSKTLATQLLMDALKKYGTIYEESVKIAASYEKQNLIQAYFAGVKAMQKNDVDIDSFLNHFNTPINDTNTPTTSVSN
jgi:hypothetical protein